MGESRGKALWERGFWGTELGMIHHCFLESPRCGYLGMAVDLTWMVTTALPGILLRVFVK